MYFSHFLWMYRFSQFETLESVESKMLDFFLIRMQQSEQTKEKSSSNDYNDSLNHLWLNKNSVILKWYSNDTHSL